MERLIEAAKVDMAPATCHLSFNEDGVKIYGRLSGWNGNPIAMDHIVPWIDIEKMNLNPLPLAMLKMRDALMEERDVELASQD